MEWKEYHQDVKMDEGYEFALPWCLSSQPAWGVVVEGSLKAPRRVEWLVAPDSNRLLDHVSVAVAFAEVEELASATLWQPLLQQSFPLVPLFERHSSLRIEAARYQKRLAVCFGESTAPGPELFFPFFQLADNYRNRSEWREYATLDDLSLDLAKFSEVPLAVLRLWNRFDEGSRGAWLSLFASAHFKRNLVREIIVDLYDLDDSQRKSLLESATKEIGSGQREQRAKSGLAEQLRDKVRSRRNAGSELLRDQEREVLRQLDPVFRKRARLLTPGDYEGGELRLEISFGSLDELQTTIAKLGESLGDEEQTRLIERLIELES